MSSFHANWERKHQPLQGFLSTKCAQLEKLSSFSFYVLRHNFAAANPTGFYLWIFNRLT